eukprot:COSAG01_NODE_5372_length_4300_cov_2310.826511_4_plen_31_part_00
MNGTLPNSGHGMAYMYNMFMTITDMLDVLH